MLKDGYSLVSLKDLGSFPYDAPDSYSQPIDALGGLGKKS